MKSQTKVGILFSLAALSVVVFMSFLGRFSFLGDYKRIIIAYNFVGGLEQGSHVRLMGIKVGKVEKVEFRPDYVAKSGEEVKLHIHIKVREKAFPVIRTDSKYYINMAGIIGEKYLEISPGSSDKDLLEPGAIVRGVDPPRVDQLVSQGYALAGKILSVVEDNEDSVKGVIGSIDGLVGNLNKVLITIDKITTKREYRDLIRQVHILSSEMTALLKDANQGNIKIMLESMQNLLGKLEKIEEKEIRDFLQKEGIKARVSL